MRQNFKYVIIGSGPTGLGAGYRLRELGIEDFLIIEKENHVGGLATSFVDSEGFTWDVGGHVQFSHYQYFDDLMIKALGTDGWIKHQRESWIWIKNRFIPYPFQNNIKYLPKESLWKCLDGLIALYKHHDPHQPKNFREWIYQIFGSSLAEEFMIPYNFKVWAYPATEMSYQWIGERVARVDLQRIVKNVILDTDDLSWGPNTTFQFPKRGGTGAIWNAVACLVGHTKIRTNTAVSRIDAKENVVILTNGYLIGYKYLLSTLPMDILLPMIIEAPADIVEAASYLLHSSTNIVGVGLRGKPKPELATKCWMYFPEGNSPYYRVTVFSNYSPNNVPDISRYWSLMAETSESIYKPINRLSIVDETIRSLMEDGLIQFADDIYSTFQFSSDYGYPTPSLKRDAILKKVNPFLEQNHIFSRGRFGGWKYEVSNQDHSLMQGVEWVNRIVLNVPEVTLPFPETANANWGKFLLTDV
jgi:protoporphyrinogen oxidase